MSRPNILLITTDQQRFDTICALGNPSIFTPHLNWLTDRGITFTRCYSTSPVCIPARATIMTGKQGYTIGLTSNDENRRPLAEHPTLPGVLTQNGYQTRAQGKMHFSPTRANYGFEYMELPFDSYYKEANGRTGIPKAHGVGENEVEPVISTVSETESLTYHTVRRSIDFLESRDETRPFFLWTSFTKPHPPFDPCLNYWLLYQNMPMPDPVFGDWSDDIEKVPKGFLAKSYILNNMYRLSPQQIREVRRAYYACITQIDYTLGLLFARMRELGLFESTWILFTSDHGDMLGDHHLGAKSVFFEGSAHVPLIVCPPPDIYAGKYADLAGTKCDTLVSLADVMPTILSICKADVPEGLDGKNILDFVRTPQPRRALYGQTGKDYFAWIEGDYKYHWTSMGGAELLFNVKEDPYESRNLAGLPEYQEKLAAFREQLTAHIRRYNPNLVQNDRLVVRRAPENDNNVKKWPGFHSTSVLSDVLH